MGYTSAAAKAFIKDIAPLIQQEARLRGYKVCSPIIAQALCESAAGTSSLGYKYHNYFGMKCGSSWKGKSVNLSTKEEYTVGTLTNIKANFRVYDTMADGVKGYFDFISTKRYSNLKTAITPYQYLELIKADGYATSSSYVSTNMSLIKKFGLDKYDDVSPIEAASLDKVAQEVINGKWGNGPERRARLEAAGYNYSEVQKVVNAKLKK